MHRRHIKVFLNLKAQRNACVKNQPNLSRNTKSMDKFYIRQKVKCASLSRVARNLGLLNNFFFFFLKNSHTEFYKNRSNGLVADTRSEKSERMAGRGLHVKGYSFSLRR